MIPAEARANINHLKTLIISRLPSLKKTPGISRGFYNIGISFAEA